MKDRARADLLASAAEDLALLLAGTAASKALREMEPKGRPLATRAVEKLEEYAAGWPAGGNGAGGATNIVHTFTEPDGSEVTLTVPQHPDRTGEQVAAQGDREPKFVSPQVLDSHLRAAAHHLQEAASIAAHACVPTDATSKTRDDSDDWCSSCARVKDHKGRAFMVPSRVANGSVSRTPKGTAGGQDGAPLCGKCYGWVLGEKAWPPKRLIEAARDGKRWTSKLVRDVLGRDMAESA